MKPIDIALLVAAAGAAIAAFVYWRKTAPERAVEAKLPTSQINLGSVVVTGSTCPPGFYCGTGYISGNPTSSRQR